MVGLKLFHRAAMTFISCWLLDTSLYSLARSGTKVLAANCVSMLWRPVGPVPNFSPARKGWGRGKDVTERRRCGTFSTNTCFAS